MVTVRYIFAVHLVGEIVATKCTHKADFYNKILLQTLPYHFGDDDLVFSSLY